jgi:hypothetical protein
MEVSFFDGEWMTPEDFYSDWHKLQYYVTDDEIDVVRPQWIEFCDNRNHRVTFSSASYSGHRWVTFLFEDEADGALFRLFFGGQLLATQP